ARFVWWRSLGLCRNAASGRRRAWLGEPARVRKSIRRVHDIGKRLLPTGEIERAIVDRPNQLRQGLMRYCIGHGSPPTSCQGLSANKRQSRPEWVATYHIFLPSLLHIDDAQVFEP